MSSQLSFQFGPALNSGLFSTHWLTHRLQLEPEWADMRQASNETLEELAKLWKTERKRVGQYQNEQALEYGFIQPVLKLLGWTPNYQTFLQGRKPDYALFQSDEALDAALAAGGRTPEFWEHASVVADAKAWSISLDRRITSADQREFPPQQMEWYLDRSRLPFGILTNGQQWRLIPREKQPFQGRFDTYFEFRLCKLLDRWLDRKRHLLEEGQLQEDFLQFYLFFSPQGFVAAPGRQPLAVRAIAGSSEYRLGIGDDLRERAFDAVRLSIQGLLDFSANELNANDHLELCRLESFTLIYRLLFILYAEDRGLLPFRTNTLYTNNRSLGRFRDEIHGQLGTARKASSLDYPKDHANLWSDLRDLFDLVDRGNARYGVPAYNGGLFDPDEHPFWEEKQLPDWYLARIIQKLGHAPDKTLPDAGEFRVDYRDLAIQHLGGVYESLLELQPRVATVPMIVVRKRTRERTEEKIIPASHPVEDGYEKTGEKYSKGMVFLQTNKGERRASGSYYTPDHIVKHIVEQVLGPLCQQIEADLLRDIQKAELAFEKSGSVSDQERLNSLQAEFDDRILRLRVLDPSMGSGHFLLRACNFLAEEIATHQYARDEELADATGESAVVYWKRKVAENCLYGVDLNGLAVELAKLALWLETVAVDQPLTFLNHHLRCGNSLVGPQAEDLGRLPGEGDLSANVFKKYVRKSLPGMLQPLAEIRSISSQSVGEVKRKLQLFRQFERQQRAFHRLADVWTTAFLPRETAPWTAGDYQRALSVLDKPTKFEEAAKEDWFIQAESTAKANQLNGFAWELEFPDVFFHETGRLEKSGFDAVIGNPPYDVLSEAESGRDLSVLRSVIDHSPVYAPSKRGKNNLYKLFVCRSLQLLADGGYLGFITPMAVLGDDQAAELRRTMLGSGRFVRINAFPQKDNPQKRVFPEAKLSTAVFILQRTADAVEQGQRFPSDVHPGRELSELQASLHLSTAEVPLYDPANLTIVSCSQADWDLATRIMQSGRMARLGEYAEFFQGEVNETNERTKGNISYNDGDGPKVLRGAGICLYVVRPPSQGTDFYVLVDKFLNGRSPESKAFHHQHARIGLQESCPQNNFRRIIASFIPEGQFCNHKVNYCPTHRCKFDLRFLLAVLNSKLSDWYFRLGSTNAAVSHYQLYNLPCPVFASSSSASALSREAPLRALRSGNVHDAETSIGPLLEVSPFDPLIRDCVIVAVDRITAIEQRRGSISRSDRSALSPEAQPYQDFIDRVFFAMAGLTPEESAGLEERLATML